MSWVYPRSSMVTILPVSSPFSGLVLILFVTSMDSLLTIVVYLLLSARLNKFSCTPNTSREKEVFWVSQRNEYWTSSLVLQYTKRKKKEFTSTAIGSLNRLSFADEMFSSNESDLLSLLEAPPLLSFHLRSCLRPHLPPLSLSRSLSVFYLLFQHSHANHRARTLILRFGARRVSQHFSKWEKPLAPYKTISLAQWYNDELSFSQPKASPLV